MGCGVSKTSAASPVVEDVEMPSEPCQSPIPVEPSLPAEVKADDPREPISSGSFSSNGLDSDRKSNSSTEDETTEGQPCPLGIKEPVGDSNEDGTTPEAKKGCIAFDISLDGSPTTTLDGTQRRPLPKRLRHLEPLSHVPQLTTEKLMEKLEKAEEKRQKALAKYKGHASRRKQVGPRKNEQMGDVISSIQTPEDMPESDQSVGEKCDTEELTAHPDTAVRTCDQNVNWNEPTLPISPAISVSSTSRNSTNQNNNNIGLRLHNLSELNSCPNYIPTSRSMQLRYGCFLQAVQEEEEGEESQSDDDTTSVSSLSPLPEQYNNNNELKSIWKRSEYRSKGL